MKFNNEEKIMMLAVLVSRTFNIVDRNSFEKRIKKSYINTHKEMNSNKYESNKYLLQ